MPARRRVDPETGDAAVRAWAADPGGVPRSVVATAVRFTLEELSACAPGRSVEVRVPPFGVTQVVGGTSHRRGTPPSVVETDAATWLALSVGRLDWGGALASGRLSASGERCNLSTYLPLVMVRTDGSDAVIRQVEPWG